MTTKKKINPNWMDSLVFRYPTPVGTAWIQIIESAPGKIHKIFIHVGKGGSAVNALCAGIAELATRLLSNGDSISSVIATLSGITTDKYSTEKGAEIRSPTDALIMALIQYKASTSNVRRGKMEMGR